jgi:hypothetical protein
MGQKGCRRFRTSTFEVSPEWNEKRQIDSGNFFTNSVFYHSEAFRSMLAEGI